LNWSTVAEIIGPLLVAAGLAFIFWPSALIAAGLMIWWIGTVNS
jgi:hypothetical protein